MNGPNKTTINLYVEIPCVSCDVCNRQSFTPPGIWTGSWTLGSIPPVLSLRHIDNESTQDPRPLFEVVGAASEDEAVTMALSCGWKQVKLASSTVIVCPKCQALLKAIAEKPDA
jgi:hypothetical protein